MTSLKIDKSQRFRWNCQIKNLINTTRYKVYHVVIEVFTDVRLEFTDFSFTYQCLYFYS